MAGDNIFSGLKVVDLASFIAGPSAAVILSDFGADVVKVEPPSGDPWRIAYKVPPQPRAADNYPWHLNNRNKRGLALDLKSPHAKAVVERLVKWADVLIVNTPRPARKIVQASPGGVFWRGSSHPAMVFPSNSDTQPDCAWQASGAIAKTTHAYE